MAYCEHAACGAELGVTGDACTAVETRWRVIQHVRMHISYHLVRQRHGQRLGVQGKEPKAYGKYKYDKDFRAHVHVRVVGADAVQFELKSASEMRARRASRSTERCRA